MSFHKEKSACRDSATAGRKVWSFEANGGDSVQAQYADVTSREQEISRQFAHISTPVAAVMRELTRRRLLQEVGDE